jgi:sugar lactone lactonase YvrE
VKLAALGALLCGSHAFAADAPASLIKMSPAGTIPEGVEYDTKNKRFLVGSLTQGTVFVVGKDGSLTPFVQDAELKGSAGIEVDEERNRLLVTATDRGAFSGQSAGQAKLGIYDLTSGKRLALVDLTTAGPKDAKAHFANDVAVGSDGSAYVTDTMARVVYKVDPKNNVSVFLPNTFGAIAQHQFNGIVVHPSGGYLLVAESVAGDLYKVPLATPGTFTKVKVPESIAGVDGITWHPDGSLIVVRNDKSQSVIALRSSDNWATATVDSKGTFGTQGTTAAVNSDGVYVVQPFFGDPKAQTIIEHVHLK